MCMGNSNCLCKDRGPDYPRLDSIRCWSLNAKLLNIVHVMKVTKKEIELSRDKARKIEKMRKCQFQIFNPSLEAC